MKRLFAMLLATAMLFSLFGCGRNEQEEAEFQANLNVFFDKVSESKILLDTTAKELEAGNTPNAETLAQIKAMDAEIVELYKQIKDDRKYERALHLIMSAYTECYQCISSANRDDLYHYKMYEKILVDYLRELSYEL